MDFAYSPEQDEFRATVRRFLTDLCPSARVREVAEGGDGYDGVLWRRLCDELGLPGLHAPEEHGGAGFSLVESALVMEELGRALAPVPALATTIAIEAVQRLGDERQHKELLPGLLSGERIGAVALAGPADTDPEAATVSAAGSTGRRTLTGQRPVVPHGGAADLIVVPAVAQGVLALYLVDADAPGVTVTALPTLDITRPATSLELRDTPATLLDAPTERVERVVDVARVLLAAEMVGAAGACLDGAVEYAKQRTQFNRPIGSFQAVKHRCAEMAVELDAARAAAMFAAMVAVDDEHELARAAPLVKAQAADTFELCAGAGIQIHGGIGFTWEHDAHLYYRRAMSTKALFGSSAAHRALLADRVGI